MCATNDFLVLIVGESGSGKTTAALELKKRYGYNVIESYTTRPERYRGEQGHIFVDKLIYEKHKELGITIAETTYLGNYYWAVKKQIENMGISLYVIDPAGVESMEELCPDIPKVILYLKCNEDERIRRLMYRENINEVVTDKIFNDRKVFKIVRCDYAIDANRDINMVIDDIQTIIEREA